MDVASTLSQPPSNFCTIESKPSNATTKTYSVAVLGLGYVGLPLAENMLNANMNVIGYDINKEHVAQLNNGVSSISHIPNSTIENMIEKGFRATGEMDSIVRANVIVICVPTPVNKNREPDLSLLLAALDSISDCVRPGQLISLESTTWPGTTRQVVANKLASLNLTIGHDIFVTFSPERHDPGNPDFDTQSIPKLVGGVTEKCLVSGVRFYEQIVDKVVPVSTPEVAEMAKLVENTQRLVNISLMNELKIVCDSINIDIFEVVRAAATKPFGFTKYFPGPGVGGHCIPVDPHYLEWKAKEFGLSLEFIQASAKINASMPKFVVKKIGDALNSNLKAIKGSRILIVGVSYKPGVGDLRESSSVKIIEILNSMGADIHYVDPLVPELELSGGKTIQGMSSINPKILREQDAVVILTDHNCFDYCEIQEFAKILVDTRGRYECDEVTTWRA